MKVLLLNGPNLKLLGSREPKIYGNNTYDRLVADFTAAAGCLGISTECVQSDIEGELVTQIGTAPARGFDGIVINPGAYSHTSVAIRDAISAIDIPVVEVHISNVFNREDFRKTLMTGAVCRGVISGLGFYSYIAALNFLHKEQNI